MGLHSELFVQLLPQCPECENCYYDVGNNYTYTCEGKLKYF